MFFITEFFTVNKLAFWKEETGILVSCVLVSSIAIGGVWSLATTLSDIQSKLSALNERVGGLETRLNERMDSFDKRLGNLEVGVQSINEYLRRGDIHFVPRGTSTSGISQVPKGQVFQDTSPPYKPPPAIMP